jgi:hypothetical protein
MYAGFQYAYATLSFSPPLILFSLALFTVCTSLARAGPLRDGPAAAPTTIPLPPEGSISGAV